MNQTILYLPKQIELQVEHIIYLESDSNYTIIHRVSSNRKIVAAKSLCHLQEELCPNHFVRINRGNLINTQFITQVIRFKSMIQCTLSNGEMFQSSRRRTESVLEKLMFDKKFRTSLNLTI